MLTLASLWGQARVLVGSLRMFTSDVKGIKFPKKTMDCKVRFVAGDGGTGQ